MERDLLHFVETGVFTKKLEKIASTDVLFELQSDLLKDPELGDLIPGCAGARKARIANKQQSRGKSGSFRYIYIYIKVASTVYLLTFYGKNEKADLSKTERNELAKLDRKLKGIYGEK